MQGDRKSPWWHPQLFQMMSDAVLITDPDGRVLDCNAAAEVMYDRRRPDMLGRTRAQIVGATAGLAEAEVSATLERDGRWAGEAAVPGRPDDVVAVKIVRLLDRHGRVRGFARMDRDVTAQRRTAALLTRAEQRWHLTLKVAPTGLAVLDLDGRFTRVNDALCAILGYPAATLLRMSFQDITHPDDLAADEVLAERLLLGEIDRGALEKRYLPASGHPVWVQLSVALIRNEMTGTPERWVATIEDITHRRQAADRLNSIIAAQVAIADIELSPSKVMKAICEHARDLTGAEGACIEIRDEDDLVCRAVAGATGEALGLHIPLIGSLSGLAITTEQTLICDDTQTDQRATAETCPPVGVRSLVVAPLRRGTEILGVIKVFSAETQAFSDTDRSTLQLLAASFAAAMTNARRMETASQQAVTDSLTGLANRTSALLYLHQALLRQALGGGCVGVLFIDLDHFKDVNDTYGHAAGDQILITVADTLRTLVRRTEIAARFGGDEFVIVCEGPQLRDELVVLSDRLITMIAGSYRIDLLDRRASATIGASIGVAITTVPVTAHALLQDADEAMYEAKHAGGNRYVTRHLPELLDS